MRYLLVLLCVTLICSSAFAQSKKLIEFGWDEPDTAFMRKHIAQMEKTPFDGTVFTVKYRKPGESGSGSGDFMGEAWGSRAFTEPELAGAVEDLKATPFKKFTHNFLRFNVLPGEVDWFDDAGFATVVNNAKLAAKVAKEGKAAGVLFDIEQYDKPLFDYRKARDAKSKSWEQYAAQVRQRGREVMNAFQSEYPDVTVFLTFGYSLPFAQAGFAPDKAKLATVDYGLLAPFLDGMFDVASGNSRIVDGFEISYGYKEAKQFEKVPKMVKERALPLVGTDHAKYLKHLSISMGLWMDNDWRSKAWDVNDFAKNYFTPEQFEASLTKALATADEYVWIYTESPKWWTPPAGEPDKLPAAYLDAVKRARAAGK